MTSRGFSEAARSATISTPCLSRWASSWFSSWTCFSAPLRSVTSRQTTVVMTSPPKVCSPTESSAGNSVPSGRRAVTSTGPVPCRGTPPGTRLLTGTPTTSRALCRNMRSAPLLKRTTRSSWSRARMPSGARSRMFSKRASAWARPRSACSNRRRASRSSITRSCSACRRTASVFWKRSTKTPTLARRASAWKGLKMKSAAPSS